MSSLCGLIDVAAGRWSRKGYELEFVPVPVLTWAPTLVNTIHAHAR